jgi:hypothetical protein
MPKDFVFDPERDSALGRYRPRELPISFPRMMTES